MLPARDGEPRGGVERSTNAPNCPEFVNWTKADDALVGSVEVVTAHDLGMITLPVARGELALRALGITGKSVMVVRRVTLTLEP